MKSNSAQSSGRKARSLGFKLAAVLFGVLVSSLLIEGLVLALLGEQVKFPRHVVEAPWGLRYNEPSASYRHKSADVNVWFRINEQGMRANRSYAYAKPKGVKRIVSLGDSFTVGYEVELGDCFSTILERALNETYQGRVEVLNSGVSGFSNAEEVLYFERELVKYDPDIVLLSFFANDLVDNERTGLLALEDGELVLKRDRYVPAGRVGNALNRSAFFNFLSSYSNAFVLLKERATLLVKRELVEANRVNLGHELDDTGARVSNEQRAAARTDQQRRLAAAILNRLYEFARERGIAVVIQSIPSGGYPLPHGDRPIQDLFPGEYFDVDRPGLAVFKAIDVLGPHVGKEPLVFLRSHFHWTPFSHRLSGRALASLIEQRGWLDASGVPEHR